MILIVFIQYLSLVNHRANSKNVSSRGFLCCLATSNDENVITSAKFDKCHYFDHIFSGDPMLYFGLYVTSLFIEAFWFGTKILCMIQRIWAI